MTSLSDLTVSATARARGMSNDPATATHRAHLSMLASFLDSLPFTGTITSGYRSPQVNAAVGGSATSQHPNGLGVDFVPMGMTNRELATWLWLNQADYPELDQVIWYSDTNHAHIGICPPGAVGCVGGAPRRSFMSARKEGSQYSTWAPSQAEQAAVQARFPQSRPWSAWAWGALFLGLAGAGMGGFFAYRHFLR
jgi:hypothetical protein